jgi:protocatechuate 3,4-dioxygenase beta subunit
VARERAHEGGSTREPRGAAAPRPRALDDEDEAARKAIESLEEPYRSAALLRWRYGLAPAEIADVRGEPPGTTRSILSRAVVLVRGALGRLPGAFLVDAAGLRGLDRVRTAVVREAAKAPPVGIGVAGTGVAAALLSGGVVTKVVAATVLLAVAYGGFELVRGSRGGPAAGARPNVEARGASTEERETARAAALEGSRPEAGTASPRRGPLDPFDSARPRAHGVVVSDDGKPVGHAVVAVYAARRAKLLEYDSSENDETSGSQDAGTSTRDDGRFELDVPDVERPVLLVLARGFGSGFVEPVVAGIELRVVLKRSAAIRGRVLDAKGRPVSGAAVAIYVLAGAFHTERHATSGPDGAYRLDDVPAPAAASGPLTSRLVVDAEGYARQILNPLAELPGGLAAGGEAEVNVVLSRGARVRGRVVEAASGKPVAGARVLLWTLDGMFRHQGEQEHPANPFALGEATTGEDGRYAFAGVPCRGFHDSPNASASLATGRKVGSWLAASKAGLTTVVREVVLAAEGAELEVDLPLDAALSVEGRVVDTRGEPVAGAHVWATVLREGAMGALPSTVSAAFPTEFGTTRADGTYRLDGVAVPKPVGVPLQVGAQSPRWQAGSPSGRPQHVLVPVHPPFEGLRRVPDHVLPAEVLPWARVRVLDPAGAPVLGAEVGWFSTWMSERTDAEGRAQITRTSLLGPSEKDLPPQPVYAHAPGFAVARVEATLAAAPDEEAPEAVVRLAPGFRITGRVTTDGEPLPADTVVTVGNGSLPFEVALASASVAARGIRASRTRGRSTAACPSRPTARSPSTTSPPAPTTSTRGERRRNPSTCARARSRSGRRRRPTWRPART